GDNDFAVARLTPGGQLDTSFDGDGRRTVGIDIPRAGDDLATDVAIDAQGRIVVGGYAEVDSTFFSGTDYDFAVVRLNANGSLDTSFSGDGKQTIAFNRGGAGFDVANALAIDSLGRIVLVGSAQRNSAINGVADNDMAVARLNANGTIDSTFAVGGKTTISF